MKTKEKLTYKDFTELSFKQQLIAKKRLVKNQNEWDCKFGYDSNNKLVRILDYGVLSDIFSI